MNQFEAMLIWSAAIGYTLATVLVLRQLVFGHEKGRKIVFYTFLTAVGAHLLSLVIRSLLAGHLPVMGIYENAAAAGLFVTLPAAVVVVRKGRLKTFAFLAAPITLFLLGYGLMHYDRGGALTPPYRSTWLYIHVLFANLSYGSYALVCGAGITYLLKDRPEGGTRGGCWPGYLSLRHWKT